MKNLFLISSLLLIITSSCNKVSSIVNSDSNNEVIAYNNAYLKYSDKVSDITERTEKLYETSSLLTKAKSYDKMKMIGMVFTNHNAPTTTVYESSVQVNLLNPEKYLGDEGEKLTPEIKKLNTIITAIIKDRKELEAYYDNEDYLDDKWVKAQTINESLRKNLDSIYVYDLKMWDVITPLADIAEDEMLATSPIGKESILAKELINLLDESVYTLEEDAIDVKQVTKDYEALETKLKEAKAVNTDKLKEYSKLNSYNGFCEGVEEYLGKIRKATRDNAIDDSDYDEIARAYEMAISDYNSFVM